MKYLVKLKINDDFFEKGYIYSNYPKTEEELKEQAIKDLKLNKDQFNKNMENIIIINYRIIEKEEKKLNKKKIKKENLKKWKRISLFRLFIYIFAISLAIFAYFYNGNKNEKLLKIEKEFNIGRNIINIQKKKDKTLAKGLYETEVVYYENGIVLIKKLRNGRIYNMEIVKNDKTIIKY